MTPDVSPARRAVVSVIAAVALFAVVVVQLTVVNRLPLPGGAVPDLVLLLVAAIAVTASPLAAAVAGFGGGLALDIAPPAAHYAGEYALVFCLAGYAAARVGQVMWDLLGARDSRRTFAIMAVAVAAGEAGKAALGLLLSDPDVTGTAIARVLPGAVLADLLLAPLFYLGVARLAHAPVRDTPERPVETGRVPKLRLAGTGEPYRRPSAARRVPHLPLADTRGKYRRPSWARHVPHLPRADPAGKYRRPSWARRVPRLRLSDARAADFHRTGAAGSGSRTFSVSRPAGQLHLRPGPRRSRHFQSGRTPFVAGRTRKVHFRGDLRVRTAPGRAWSPVRTASPAPRRKRKRNLLRMVRVGR